MPRYDFVDPYVASHWTQDAANSWDKVLESERMRRAEIEQKRRFDEQLGIQKGYLNVRTTESGQGARERGWVSPTEWKPEASATTFAQDRGHGQTLDTMKFGDQLQVGREGRQRGYEAEDRNRIGSYFRRMGFEPEQAGALTEAFPQYQYLNPQELDPRMQAWERELINLRGEWARRTAAANNGGGGTENLFRILNGLNTQTDNDRIAAQQIRTLDPPQRTLMQMYPDLRTPEGRAVDSTFKADSTSVMRGREQQIRFYTNRAEQASTAAQRLLQGTLGPNLMPPVPADSIDRAFTRPGATTDSTPPAAVAPAAAVAPTTPSWLPSNDQDLTGQLPFRPAPRPTRTVPHALGTKLEPNMYGGLFEDRSKDYRPGFGARAPAPAARPTPEPSRPAAAATPIIKNYEQELAKARRALAEGRDAAQVRATFKQRTGKELP